MIPEDPYPRCIDPFRLNADRNFLVDGSNALGLSRIPNLEMTAADLQYLSDHKKKALISQIESHLYSAAERLSSHFEKVASDDPSFAKYWNGLANLVDDADLLNAFQQRLPLGKRFREQNNKRKETLIHCIGYFRPFIVPPCDESEKLPRIIRTIPSIRKRLRISRRNGDLVSRIIENPLKEKAEKAQYAIDMVQHYSRSR